MHFVAGWGKIESGGAMEEATRRCPLCDAEMHAAMEGGCQECRRCGTLARFSGDQLIALNIPHYYLRLEELRRRNAELVNLIEMESRKGAGRDMRGLRSMHEERQRVLSEFSFLSYFEQFVERWQER